MFGIIGTVNRPKLSGFLNSSDNDERPLHRDGDYTSKWPVESESTAAQSLPKPALKHARTELQSGSESRPIRRTSRCNNVTGNNLKYDG